MQLARCLKTSHVLAVENIALPVGFLPFCKGGDVMISNVYSQKYHPTIPYQAYTCV